jgi:hypothetical protein
MEKTLENLDALARYDVIMEIDERVTVDDSEEEEAENELEERNLFHKRMEIIVPVIDCIPSREIDSDDDSEVGKTKTTELEEREVNSNIDPEHENLQLVQGEDFELEDKSSMVIPEDNVPIPEMVPRRETPDTDNDEKQSEDNEQEVNTINEIAENDCEDEGGNEYEGRSFFHKRMGIIVPKNDYNQFETINSDDDSEMEIMHNKIQRKRSRFRCQLGSRLKPRFRRRKYTSCSQIIKDQPG